MHKMLTTESLPTDLSMSALRLDRRIECVGCGANACIRINSSNDCIENSPYTKPFAIDCLKGTAYQQDCLRNNGCMFVTDKRGPSAHLHN